MCLDMILNSKKFPKIGYKVVTKCSLSNTKFKPINKRFSRTGDGVTCENNKEHFKTKLNYKLGKKSYKENNDIICRIYNPYRYTRVLTYESGIHSFLHYNDAYNFMISCMNLKKIAIIECEIIKPIAMSNSVVVSKAIKPIKAFINNKYGLSFAIEYSNNDAHIVKFNEINEKYIYSETLFDSLLYIKRKYFIREKIYFFYFNHFKKFLI